MNIIFGLPNTVLGNFLKNFKFYSFKIFYATKNLIFWLWYYQCSIRLLNFEAFCFKKFEFYSKIFVYFESFWWFYANFVFIVFGSSWRGALPHCGYLRRALHAVCVLSPIQVLHPDKNTLLQVIICPLVLYWQRFLFRDFPKFKVLKKVLKIE